MSVGFELAGLYRRPFAESLAAHRHDAYLFVENDVMIGADSLQAVCEETAWLGGSGSLVPGVMRYEMEVDKPTAPLYLTDVAHCCPPHVDAVISVRGRRYVIPSNECITTP